MPSQKAKYPLMVLTSLAPPGSLFIRTITHCFHLLSTGPIY